MAANTIVDFSLRLQNVCGMSPLSQNAKGKIKTIASFLLLLHFTGELFLAMALNWTGWDSIQDAMFFFAVFQGLVKFIYNVARRNKIKRLLHKIENLGLTDGLNMEFQNHIQKIVNITRRVLKLYIFIAIIGLSGFYFKPLLDTNNRALPFNSYHPIQLENYYIYTSFYAIQIIQSVFACTVVMTFDFLFIAFIVAIILEFRILKQRFILVNSMQEEDEDVRILIDCHNYVLTCANELDEIYSEYFLIQFITSVMFICSSLLALVVTGFAIQFFCFLCGSLLQLLIYCTLGNVLISESESVAETIYGCNWWSSQKSKFRRACVLMIQLSNKSKSLTAGGMIILNLETYTKVVKFGVSIFSLAKAMANKGP